MQVYDIENKALNSELVEQATQKTSEQMQAEASLNAAIPELQDETVKKEDTQATANAVDSLYGLLSLLPIGLTFAGMKNTANVWTDNACKGLSSACVPVFRKYAWGQRIIVFLETGGGIEELALMAVIMPLGLATYKAIELDTIKPIDDESVAMQPNPARSKQGIELANASDIKFANSDYEPRN